MKFVKSYYTVLIHRQEIPKIIVQKYRIKRLRYGVRNINRSLWQKSEFTNVEDQKSNTETDCIQRDVRWKD